jgi:hypothetical protein
VISRASTTDMMSLQQIRHHFEQCTFSERHDNALKVINVPVFILVCREGFICRLNCMIINYSESTFKKMGKLIIKYDNIVFCFVFLELVFS